jgi:ubiquinone/menaquinone biosynthesis C-methylase UbiE
MRRLDTPELLDEAHAPHDDMARSLRDLRRFNAWAGGGRVYRKLVRRLLGERREALVIDLGAGTADLVDSLGMRAIAVDINLRHLLYERERSRTRRVVGDAKRLPFRDDAADAVTSSHFFHHFTPEENADVIAESLRVAKVGIAFTDTRRHRLPLLFTQLLAIFRLVGRITRFDAPASVRRGYTTDEVRAIAPGATVDNYVPFRWGLLQWK